MSIRESLNNTDKNKHHVSNDYREGLQYQMLGVGHYNRFLSIFSTKWTHRYNVLCEFK